MPPVNILIKPASSACNMACSYCFYRDVAQNRETAFEGMLSLETMEQVVISGLEYAEYGCSFTFQGGEPTLRGLDFFREVVRLQEKHNKKGLEIRNNIQTNGLLIDGAWAEFFHDQHFLVGLSLDGPAELHNFNRRSAPGKNTFNQVMRAAELFKKYQVDYNILCVVTGKNARSIEKIYRFYQKQGFHWLQFIPCLEPLGAERGQERYHLSSSAYGEFLVRLFDLWYADLKAGKYTSIRHLDNWLFMLLGEQPEACNMAGQCSIQFVVEGDGGVYPCDFYVLDEWRLGTVGQESFADMRRTAAAKRFVASSLEVPEECTACGYYALCRNGCRRDRPEGPGGSYGKNYYCEAYGHFFRERGKALKNSIAYIRQIRAGQAAGA